jgi:hypothetical protein
MRRYLGIIITITIVLVVLIGLNAISLLNVEQKQDSETDPQRSSYNAGPTGTRAFYQLLEESGYRVARWRDRFDALESKAEGAALIVVGPFELWESLSAPEAEALQAWIAGGGQTLIISRSPEAQFGDQAISTKITSKADFSETNLDRLIDERSDVLIVQPTELTRHLGKLAISHLATRMKFDPARKNSAQPGGLHLPQAEQTSSEQEAKATPESTPARQTARQDEGQNSADEAGEMKVELAAPVIHLGDADGAVLADFAYGAGRVIFLSDPFVIANNGIGRGSNLQLALNLIHALGGRERPIFFDEYHHGYRSESHPLVSYFRGTPLPWVLGQLLAVALIIAYSAGRRFARPLPLPQVDRHSPLEFVGSMANLQQGAAARDLALENIYPRFKAQLCRALGVSVRARPEGVAAGLSRRRLKVSASELEQTLSESERALAGEPLDDHRLIALVSSLRRISAQLK